MEVYLNEISGIADAMVSMLMSKRTWTRDVELNIREMCDDVLDRKGRYHLYCNDDPKNKSCLEYEKYLQMLTKWGRHHITMLRFIDLSITVKGLHRGGQDDWDSHAARFNNRIIRSSTRLSNFGNEMSEWYQDKIIPTDVALGIIGLDVPKTLIHNGEEYVKGTNGYIRKDLANNKDVKRGLYMLSIPSNFIFKINLTEWSHVYKERNKLGTANPEVKICCEKIADMLEQFQPLFTRELFEQIKN